MTTPQEFDIDDQIDSIEREIAEYTQKLFEAKGMLRMARHLKQNCIIFARRPELAPSSPARQ